jgi:hypothetical protein
MGKFRSGLAGWGRMLAYPLLRPAQDIQRSVRSMREAARTAQVERAQRREAAAEVTSLLSQQQTPQQKFEQGVIAWGWSEQELVTQGLYARRTRIASLATGLVAFGVTLGVMQLVGGFLLLVLAAVAVAMPLGAVLQGLRFAWWEYAIETRSLIPMRAFVARADLLSRLFSLRRRR